MVGEPTWRRLDDLLPAGGQVCPAKGNRQNQRGMLAPQVLSWSPGQGNDPPAGESDLAFLDPQFDRSDGLDRLPQGGEDRPCFGEA